MELLHAHFLSQKPDAVVEVVRSWPKKPGYNLQVKERMRKKIKTYPFAGAGNNYVLFDNAHHTYLLGYRVLGGLLQRLCLIWHWTVCSYILQLRQPRFFASRQ
jgi:hypothetical protein